MQMLIAAFPEIGRKLFKGLLNENEERIELLIFRPMGFLQSSRAMFLPSIGKSGRVGTRAKPATLILFYGRTLASLIRLQRLQLLHHTKAQWQELPNCVQKL